MAKAKQVVLTPGERRTAIKEARKELRDAQVAVNVVERSAQANTSTFNRACKKVDAKAASEKLRLEKKFLADKRRLIKLHAQVEKRVIAAKGAFDKLQLPSAGESAENE